MFESLTSSFGGAMVSPGLFLGGALLVASPIIIHLLNKRKFKTIDWAAMDFLLEADKRNRRRIRLENLLLLALRCLAVLLIAFLVARPLLPSGATAGLLESARIERIVLLDDSRSMEARADGSSPFEDAKRGLIDFIDGLAAAASDDSLTLVLASQPQRPLLNGVPVTGDTLLDIKDDIEALEASDTSPDFETALLEIEKSLKQRSANVNRIVYVISDMRHCDWSAAKANEPAAAVAALRRLSKATAGCFLADVGNDRTGNLQIAGIVSHEKSLVAGVPSRFEVIVRNTGTEDAGPVQIRFTTGESIPLSGQIDRIPAGGEAAIPFTYTFSVADGSLADSPLEPVRIQAELAASGEPSWDRLVTDNVRYYAARLVEGIPTLIVDGDPSADYGRSESFFLRRALAPPGDIPSGIAVRTVTDLEFETARLDEFLVIYLCNLYRFSEPRRKTLEEWVAAGGGLVILLGDRIDEQFYNQALYRDGRGLFPAKLGTISGDESQAEWVYFNVQSTTHPVLQVFAGENNPFLEGVKIFRWWAGSPEAAELNAGRVSVVARFTDEEGSPAIIEKAHGDGRVLAIATAADRDWGSWPEDPSYLITMQELNRYMAGKSGDAGSIRVGEPIRHPLDLTRYKLDALISDPRGEQTPVQPAAAIEPAKQRDEAVWWVQFDETGRRGFYELQLTRANGERERVLFAANLDASEGDLQRVDQRLLRRDLGDAPVEIVTGAGLLALAATAARAELWLYILAALVAVMCVEQVLAWWFGLRR